MPVFIVIGFGYAAARAALFSDSAVDGVMRYAQSFALPVLLFKNVATLDLGTAFAPGMLLSFYIGAFSGFAFGFCVAHFVAKRPLTDSVAIAFAGLAGLGEFGASSFLAFGSQTTLPVAIMRLISRPGAENLQLAMFAASLFILLAVYIVWLVSSEKEN